MVTLAGKGQSSAHRLPIGITAPLILSVFGLLLWLERRRPLRRMVESKSARAGRNVAIAMLTTVAFQITERPVISRLSAAVDRREWGVLKITRLPRGLEIALAIVLLDYTLYVWHVLLHRVPWLWHMQVHHVDLDLDASTAVRFHAAEMVVSVGWRVGQVVAIGVSPLALSMWQTLLLLSVMFHHSNVRLPIRTEQWLNWFIVTPHAWHSPFARA